MKRFIRQHGKWLLINAALWCMAKQFFLAIKLWGIENTDVQRFQSPLWPLFIVVAITGLIDGIVLGCTDIAIDAQMKASRFSRRIIVKTAINLCLGVGLSTLLGPVFLGWMMGTDHAAVSREIYFAQFVILVLYFLLNTLLVQFIKLGRMWMKTDDIMELIANPFGLEENRIFLFLDLKASTSLAEQLETSRYSRLLQLCFQHLAEATRLTGGEIYQYVGDEAVITWRETPAHFEDAARFYYVFNRILHSHESEYMTQFGLLPKFKAGIHHGRVIKAQVGMMHKEIAYHGDAINTASRIQSKCSELGKQVLISESVHQQLPTTMLRRCEGSFSIRGKMKPMTLYSLSENTTTGSATENSEDNGFSHALQAIHGFLAMSKPAPLHQGARYA